MFDLVQKLVLQTGATSILGFLAGGFLEELALPFPSPLLFVGATLYVGQVLTVWTFLKIFVLIVLPTALGSTLGALIVFGLCYSGGKIAIDKLSRFTGFGWGDIEKIRAKLATRQSDEWVLFISRIIPFGPTKIFNAAAGIVRMNPGVFVLIIFFGSLIRITATFFIAWAFGGAVSG